MSGLMLHCFLIVSYALSGLVALLATNLYQQLVADIFFRSLNKSNTRFSFLQVAESWLK
jgi:hypothetical protein